VDAVDTVGMVDVVNVGAVLSGPCRRRETKAMTRQTKQQTMRTMIQHLLPDRAMRAPMVMYMGYSIPRCAWDPKSSTMRVEYGNVGVRAQGPLFRIDKVGGLRLRWSALTTVASSTCRSSSVRETLCNRNLSCGLIQP
jgi:hypothetical protein